MRGPVYATASLQRTILLTSGYVLIIDRCEAKDGQPHAFDFAYHDIGIESLLNAVNMQPYRFNTASGYQHLEHVNRGITSDAVTLHFAADKRPSEEAHAESNSTPATYNSDRTTTHSEKSEHAELTLQMLPSPATEVFTGDAPTSSSQVPVPFVIVRRSGTTTNFVTLLVASGSATPEVHFEQTGDGQFKVESAGWVDVFSDTGGLTLQHHAR